MTTTRPWVFKNFWRIGLALVLFGAGLLPTSLTHAATGAIAQSYSTSSNNISQGALVSFTSSDPNQVTLASSNNTSALAGVAVSQPLIELTNPGHNAVQVAVGGTIEALVSTANGPISIGDRITASPISGIGMKATAASQVVGTAQANLSSVKTVTKSFVNTAGKQVDVSVGLLPITVNVAYYGGNSSQGALASFVPPFLQSIANSITGKQVSPLRVLLGTTVLLLSFVAVIVMLYVAVKSGVISIGRNPLAQQALRRGLIDVIVAAIGVLVISGVVAYVILFS